MKTITLDSSTIPYLSAMLQEKLMTGEVNDAMVHARTWVRQCICHQRLIPFRDIEVNFNRPWREVETAGVMANMVGFTKNDSDDDSSYIEYISPSDNSADVREKNRLKTAKSREMMKETPEKIEMMRSKNRNQQAESRERQRHVEQLSLEQSIELESPHVRRVTPSIQNCMQMIKNGEKPTFKDRNDEIEEQKSTSRK